MGARYLISSICDGFFVYLAADLVDSHHTSALDTHHSLPEAEQEAPWFAMTLEASAGHAEINAV